MHRRQLLAGFSLVGLSLLVELHRAQARAVEIVAAARTSHDGDEECERVTTTGHAEVRRRCDGTRAHASVDNHIAVRDPRAVRPTYERPVDRVRGRGEWRIHATSDKGARRELREKMRRGR